MAKKVNQKSLDKLIKELERKVNIMTKTLNSKNKRVRSKKVKPVLQFMGQIDNPNKAPFVAPESITWKLVKGTKIDPKELHDTLFGNRFRPGQDSVEFQIGVNKMVVVKQ